MTSLSSAKKKHSTNLLFQTPTRKAVATVVGLTGSEDDERNAVRHMTHSIEPASSIFPTENLEKDQIHTWHRFTMSIVNCLN